MLWKPSETAALSNYEVFQALRDAGMPEGARSRALSPAERRVQKAAAVTPWQTSTRNPPFPSVTGVLSFLPADGPTFGDTVLKSEHLAAVNFTGSTKCVHWLAWLGREQRRRRASPLTSASSPFCTCQDL